MSKVENKKIKEYYKKSLKEQLRKELKELKKEGEIKMNDETKEIITEEIEKLDEKEQNKFLMLIKKHGASAVAWLLAAALALGINESINKPVKFNKTELTKKPATSNEEPKQENPKPEEPKPEVKAPFETPLLELSTKQMTNKKVVASIHAFEELKPLSGWTLSEDKKSLTKEFTENTELDVVVSNLRGDSKTVKISINNIDKEFKTPTLTYSETALTNGDVLVTITSNEAIQVPYGWTLAKGGKAITKVYTSNTEEKVTVSDLAGNTKTLQIKINNIDKEFNTPSVTYSTYQITNGDVLVVINSDEPMKELEGWKLSEDKLSMSKLYTTNTTEKVIVSDLVGNTCEIEIALGNIDKIINTPTVTYEKAKGGRILVTITADEAIEAVNGWTLSEDGLSISKEYSSNKTDKITITDKAGNKVDVDVEVTGIKEKDDSYRPSTGGSNNGSNNGGNNGGDSKPDPKPEEPKPEDPKEDVDNTPDRTEESKDENDGSGVTEGEKDDIDFDFGANIRQNWTLEQLYALRELIIENGEYLAMSESKLTLSSKNI